MEDILKILSDFQIQALKKGVCFDVDLQFNGNNVPSTEVKLFYSVTGDITEVQSFRTTFSTSCTQYMTNTRLHKIEQFISNISNETSD